MHWPPSTGPIQHPANPHILEWQETPIQEHYRRNVDANQNPWENFTTEELNQVTSEYTIIANHSTTTYSLEKTKSRPTNLLTKIQAELYVNQWKRYKLQIVPHYDKQWTTLQHPTREQAQARL